MPGAFSECDMGDLSQLILPSSAITLGAQKRGPRISHVSMDLEYHMSFNVRGASFCRVYLSTSLQDDSDLLERINAISGDRETIRRGSSRLSRERYVMVDESIREGLAIISGGEHALAPDSRCRFDLPLACSLSSSGQSSVRGTRDDDDINGSRRMHRAGSSFRSPTKASSSVEMKMTFHIMTPGEDFHQWGVDKPKQHRLW